MKPKFEIGKFARRKSDGKIVEKVISNNDWVRYVEDRKITGSCPMEEVDDIDVKTAFLSRLQELLATFDASIYDYEQYKLCIDLGCGEQLEWYWGNKPMNECMLTAENIFDYDND